MNMAGMSVVMVGSAAVKHSLELFESRSDELRRRYSERYLDRGKKLLENDLAMCAEYDGKTVPDNQDATGDCGRKTVPDRHASMADYIQKSAPDDLYLTVDCGQKGVFGGLWKLAEMAGCGLCIDMEKIPVLQISIELCDYADESVYEADSTGAKLFITKNAGECITHLADKGINACVIGYTTDSNDRVVRNGETVRYLTPADRG